MSTQLIYFWQRALLKGLIEALLLLLGIKLKKCYKWNKKSSRTKFVPNRTKKVKKGTKNVHIENCFRLNRNSWLQNSLIGPSWPRATFCSIVFPLMVLHDLVWYFMVLYGLFMVLYGKISIWLDLNGLFSRTYVDPNSFGLVNYKTVLSDPF